MTLQPGTRLGPYEIAERLGAGGMGEVYRARDTRLGREVAVKVLPAGFAADAERLRRFGFEAQAAGQLNHPNVLAVYDVGTHDGTPYVVTELLEGETLRQRLGGGALAPRRAIEFGLQIAQGLAAAHDRGIVHRDLKPENLFVTRDGHVKILDFGLAKLTQPEAGGGKSPGATSPDSPTALADTEPGSLLGTAGYMSPEQVRGRPADHRADIFSFGAILHEMLSGQRAFRGDSTVETLNAILKEEPLELSLSGRGIPPALDRIVRHCLEKNPDERFQSARDLAFGLQSISEISGTGALPLVRQASRARRRWLAVAGAALVLAGAGAGLFVAGGRAARAAQPTFRQLTFQRGVIRQARFAPDGRTVVYDAAWSDEPLQIRVGRVESPDARPLGIRNAVVFGVSSQGEVAVALGARWLKPFVLGGTLARVPLAGGTPREILERVEWADWSPDGTALCVVHDVKGRDQLEYPLGRTLHATEGWIGDPRVAPGGDAVAFIEHPRVGDDGGDVAFAGQDGEVHVLARDWVSASGLAWSPRGDEVWFTATHDGNQRAIWAASRAGRLRLVLRVTGTLTLHDVVANGRALVTHDTARMSLYCQPPGEERERDFSWLDWSLARAISPDGKLLLYDETGQGGGATYGVYLRATDGSPPVRLGDGAAMAISPDGRAVLSLTRGPAPQLVELPIRAGSARTWTQGSINWGWGCYSNRSGIVARGVEPGNRGRFYGIESPGATPRPISPEGLGAFGSVSPDDRWLATWNLEDRLVLVPLDGSAPLRVLDAPPALRPIGWTADAQQLYVLERYVDRAAGRIGRLDTRTGKIEIVREISPQDPVGLVGVSMAVITPDASAYAYSVTRSLSELYLAAGLR